MSDKPDEIFVEKRDGYYEVSRVTHERAFTRMRYTRAELEQLIQSATKILESEK